MTLWGGRPTTRGEPTPVGLVHDYLLVLRGAERTFAQIAGCWPEAPIYTLLYDEQGTQHEFAGRVKRTSYLQRLPVGQRNFRMLLPALPSAAELLRLGEHRVIISSSSAFGHGVHPPANAVHISYCHSPFRYVWHERERALREFPRPLRPVGSRLLDRIRAWDVHAAGRVDHFIANSQTTRERIQSVWNRDAVVVHPPVDVERFFIGEPEDYLLVVGELVPHKRAELALEAARRAGNRVKVVGEGPSLQSLRARFGDVAEFLGRVDDWRLAEVVARARALVVPNVEEFGIAAVEAQAAGRPVLAPRPRRHAGDSDRRRHRRAVPPRGPRRARRSDAARGLRSVRPASHPASCMHLLDGRVQDACGRRGRAHRGRDRRSRARWTGRGARAASRTRVTRADASTLLNRRPASS